MQKVENTRIANIHADLKDSFLSGDTLETQTVLVPFLQFPVATRTRILANTLMGSREMPFPCAGGGRLIDCGALATGSPVHIFSGAPRLSIASFSGQERQG
jgi:hypothetical protein